MNGVAGWMRENFSSSSFSNIRHVSGRLDLAWTVSFTTASGTGLACGGPAGQHPHLPAHTKDHSDRWQPHRAGVYRDCARLSVRDFRWFGRETAGHRQASVGILDDAFARTVVRCEAAGSIFLVGECPSF